jgi:hypothetical protein
MTVSQLLISGTCVYGAMFGAAVYFTRAATRRTMGALAGGVAVGGVGVGVEMFCQAHGFWRYPFSTTPYGAPLMYPALMLAFAFIALLGWRVTRRFGWRGQLVFLLVLTVLGTIRDYRVAAVAPQFFVLAPGIGTVFVDALCWLGLAAFAQAVMLVAAGPAANDPLASRPGKPV